MICSRQHLNNNEQYVKHGEDGYDLIYKIHPFFDFFPKKWCNYMQTLRLMMSLCPSRGHVDFHMYMKNSQIKFYKTVHIM